MKNLRSLIIFFVILSCKPYYVTDENLVGPDSPYKLKEKSTKVLLSNGAYGLLAKDVGGGTNYYFRAKDLTETFLFITCDLDCNQYIDQKEWNVENNTFAVMIRSKYKGHLKTKNRLIVYKIVDDKPVELLDTVKFVFKTFRFEGSDFVYVLEDGGEMRLSLL